MTITVTELVQETILLLIGQKKKLANQKQRTSNVSGSGSVLDSANLAQGGEPKIWNKPSRLKVHVQ